MTMTQHYLYAASCLLSPCLQYILHTASTKHPSVCLPRDAAPKFLPLLFRNCKLTCRATAIPARQPLLFSRHYYSLNNSKPKSTACMTEGKRRLFKQIGKNHHRQQQLQQPCQDDDDVRQR